MSMTWHEIKQRVASAGVQDDTPLRVIDIVIGWDEALLYVEGADDTCHLDITGRRRQWPASIVGSEQEKEQRHD